MKNFRTSREIKRNTLTNIQRDCLSTDDYHELVLLRINQQIESLRIEIQRNSILWFQAHNSNNKPRDYWRRLQKLDKGKYRISSERSIHRSVG